MALVGTPKDYFIHSGGSNANTGLTSVTNAVQTWGRMNDVIAANPPGGSEYVRILVGNGTDGLGFNMAPNQFYGRLGNFVNNNAAGNATVTVACANGISIEPYMPGAPVHFHDIRTYTAAGDFSQVGTTPVWKLATATVLSGLANKAVRVWRVGSASPAYLCALNPDNEIFEAGPGYADLGKDESHAWTQLDSGNSWGAADSTPTAFASMTNTLYFYSPAGNPATAWGGVAILTQENFWNHLRIEELDNWILSDQFVFLGGGQSALRLNGGSNWTFEGRVLAAAKYQPAVQVNPGVTNPNTALANCTLAPVIDMLIRDVPFYPVNTAHHNSGACDMLILSGSLVANNLKIAEKSATGRVTMFKNGGHSCIGRPVPAANKLINGMTIEPGVTFIGGQQQYCRALALNGAPTEMTNMIIGGRVFGMRTPSQIHGDAVIKDFRAYNQQEMIPAARDPVTQSGAVATYNGRFSDSRNYANVRTDGKWWDASCIATYNSGARPTFGKVVITDCEFDNSVGPCLSFSSDAVPTAAQSITVSDTVFKTSGNYNAVNVAVLIDTRNSAANAVKLINNIAVGDMQNATFAGGAKTKVALESLACAVNVGWKTYADEAAFRTARRQQRAQGT